MPIRVSCKECPAKINVPDEHAGKKVRCPKCKAVIAVPAGDEEVDAVEDRIAEAPIPKKRKPVAVEEDDAPPRPRREAIRPSRDDDGPRRQEVSTTPKRKGRKDKDDDDPRAKAKEAKKYKPCPKCGAVGAKRVMWTAWGSFYGPAMFSHVRCPDCSYAYNGKTGGSNLIPAIILVMLPLIGIIAILGGLAYVLIQKGYFAK